MFQVNNKDTRTTPNFEQVNAGWEVNEELNSLLSLIYYESKYILRLLSSKSYICSFNYMKTKNLLKKEYWKTHI